MGDYIGHVFEDIFDVKEKDPDGKYFDRVARYKCKSELYGADMLLDVNSDVYPMQLNTRYTVRVSQTLVYDVAQAKEDYDPDLFNSKKDSMMDEFDYVMHGKVYRIDKRADEGSTRAVVYVSFGGLLMQLVAEHSKLAKFALDNMVYLLVRKSN